MLYTVKQLADTAGVSVRTLHHYDNIGLLKPQRRDGNGYRLYGREAVVRLQQIMFFRELGFNLEDIRRILSQPDFNLLEALESHRQLLTRKAERIGELLATVAKTIKEMEGEARMDDIRDYYQGFSDEEIEKHRQEVRDRWGEKTLEESEQKVMQMGKEKFAQIQAEGERIFQAISDNMCQGHDSETVQAQMPLWHQWLENFHHYSDEELLGLGQAYSQHPDFIKFFQAYHPELPPFMTKAIEHYCANKDQA
jgi:DNA-binding transcriptional MerR regulator